VRNRIGGAKRALGVGQGDDESPEGEVAKTRWLRIFAHSHGLLVGKIGADESTITDKSACEEHAKNTGNA
jgi:hypothetical protein